MISGFPSRCSDRIILCLIQVCIRLGGWFKADFIGFIEKGGSLFAPQLIHCMEGAYAQREAFNPVRRYAASRTVYIDVRP